MSYVVIPLSVHYLKQFDYCIYVYIIYINNYNTCWQFDINSYILLDGG